METKRFEQPPTTEDEAKMETIVSKAKEILDDEALKQELEDQKKAYLESLADKHDEDDLVEMGSEEDDEPTLTGSELEQKMQEETSNFWNQVGKGSIREVFYRVLMEELPGEGLSFNPEARGEDGKLDPAYVTVEAAPFKTDRTFIEALEKNPAIDLLMYPDTADAQQISEELESRGVLPVGTFPRVLRRFYEDWMAYSKDKKLWEEISKLELSKVKPLSDVELEEIISKVVQQEYRKKLGL